MRGFSKEDILKLTFMIRTFLLLCCVLLSVKNFGQFHNEIVIGNTDSLYSGILNEERELWIHIPSQASTNKKYPVLYLLDGDAFFHSTVGILTHLSETGMNSICPEMIVVGIPNTNRTRDLTPYKPKPVDPFMPPKMVEESGGGEEFISFIEEELIPYIDSHYPTSSYRILAGHSLGGLTVLHTLLHHTEMFKSYVAIDPTVNWSVGRILEEFRQAALSGKSFSGVSLFTGIANFEKGADLMQSLADTSYITEGLRANIDLDSYLKEQPTLDLKYGSRFYENEIHPTLPLLSVYDALHFIFDYYDLSLREEVFMDPAFDLVTLIKEHFSRVSQRMGYEVKPDINFVNGLGYQFLMMQQMDKAGGLFKMNVSLYPEDANVYDSLGDYYAKTGEKLKAIENYEKAQAIEFHDYTDAKLKTLKVDK